MSSLYPQIRAEAEVLDWIEAHPEELEASDGILPPDILGLIDANDEQFKAKTEHLVLLMQTLDAQAAEAQREATRLRNLGTARKKRADTIRLNILHGMRETGRLRVETAMCDVRRARSAVSVEYTGDPEKIPDRYLRIKYAFDAPLAKEIWGGIAPDEPGTVDVPDEPIRLVRGEHLRVK